MAIRRNTQSRLKLLISSWWSDY